VIVDAAFLRHAERDSFRALAAELNVPFTILDCTAHEPRMRERVAARNASGGDPSEADLQVLERQLQHHEHLSAEERMFVIEAVTDKPVDAATLCDRWFARS